MKRWQAAKTAPGVWDLSWTGSDGVPDRLVIAGAASASASWLARADLVVVAERSSPARAWASTSEILARLPGCTAALANAGAGAHVLRSRCGATAVLTSCETVSYSRVPPGLTVPCVAAIELMRSDTRSAFGSSVAV